MRTFCYDESNEFIKCRSEDETGRCAKACESSADVNFESIREGLLQKYMLSMSVSNHHDSEDFCGNLNGKICTDYEANACCCQDAYDNWQSCVIEKDFTYSVGLEKLPCHEPVKCEMHRWGGGGMVALLSVSAVFVVTCLSGMFLGYRILGRRRKIAENGNCHTKRKLSDPTTCHSGRETELFVMREPRISPPVVELT